MKNLILIAFSLLSIQSAFCQTTDSTTIESDAVKIPIRRVYPSMSNIPPPVYNLQNKLVHLCEGVSWGFDFTRFRFNGNPNLMANMVAGVYSPYGETPSIMGAQANGTAYYIDGVRVVEGVLPQTMP
jgi:hypothetical protein